MWNTIDPITCVRSLIILCFHSTWMARQIFAMCSTQRNKVQYLLSLIEDVYEIDERKPNTACYNIAIKAWAKSANKVDSKTTLEISAATKAKSILMNMLNRYRLEKDSYTTTRAPYSMTFNTVMHAWVWSVHLEKHAPKAEHKLNLMTALPKEQHQMLEHAKSYSNH